MSIQTRPAHVNHESGGHCCPHCLQSSEYSEVWGSSIHNPMKVNCKLCGEPFAIWEQEIVQNVSGLIESEDDE